MNCNSTSIQSDASSYGRWNLSQEEKQRLKVIVSLMVGKTTSFEQVLRMVKEAIAGNLTKEQALLQLEMKI